MPEETKEKPKPPDGITVVVLSEGYKNNMAGDIAGFPDREANQLVNMGKATLYDPDAAPVAEDFAKMELPELRERAKAAGVNVAHLAASIPAKDQVRLKAALVEALTLHYEGLKAKAT